jgi:myo-inositol-1(or 4)-monophosphatase
MFAEASAVVDLTRRIARAELLPRFAGSVQNLKADGSVVTAADQAMQERMQEELVRRWPEYPLLGEEMSAAEQSRLLGSPGAGLWVLDPLDGTSNFAVGFPCFSVSLALLKEGRTAFGLVYDPIRDEAFTAWQEGEVLCNGQPLRRSPGPSSLAEALAAVDFKRLEKNLAARLAADPPYRSQRSIGSVALDWCWLAMGRFHLYLHGKQSLWDYAAGELILTRAGGFSCTLTGAPVFDATITPRSVVAAADEHLFRRWRGWITGSSS